MHDSSSGAKTINAAPTLYFRKELKDNNITEIIHFTIIVLLM